MIVSGFTCFTVLFLAKLYAVQEGIKLSKNDAEAKTYLLGMMDELDQVSDYSPSTKLK